MITNKIALYKEIKDTLTLSVPLVGSQLVYASSNFLSTAMVARLGEDALAASVLVSMIWMCLTVLFFGILNSISGLVSHQHGANQPTAISQLMGSAIFLGAIVTVIQIAILLSIPFVLHYSNQPPAVITQAVHYLHALLWSLPALVMLVILEQFLAGIGHAKIVLRVSLLIVPIEIPLIYALIFGKFGLPACGIAGIGYGFAMTYTVTLIGLIWHIQTSQHYRAFAVFKQLFHFNYQYLKELVVIGFPVGLMHVIELSAFTLMTFWIGHFGTTILAAHQIVLQYVWFAITLVFAMSQAVSIRVGFCAGSNNTQTVYYAAYVGMVINFICVALVALSFYFVPAFYLQLDLDLRAAANTQLIHDAMQLLAISAVLLVLDNFRIIGFGALRGLKQTKYPMYAALVSFWIVGLSTAYLLGFTYEYGGVGIWWGLTIGIGVGACMVLWRLEHALRTLRFIAVSPERGEVSVGGDPSLRSG